MTLQVSVSQLWVVCQVMIVVFSHSLGMVPQLVYTWLVGTEVSLARGSAEPAEKINITLTNNTFITDI